MASSIKRNPDRDDEVAKGAVAFTLTKAVDPALLDAELSEAMNWRKDGGIVVDGDASEASAKNPVDLWVLRDDVDGNTMRSVVTKHTPASESDRLREAEPFLTLVQKVRAGDELEDADLDAAIRVIFERLFPEASE